MSYRRTIELDQPYDEAVARAKAALSTQGFGVLTEIDMKATLKAKRDVDIEPYVILGACNPALAQRALEIEPGVGVLLPCNVVVRALGPGRSTIHVFEPGLMPTVTNVPALQPLADEASRLLEDAFADLGG
jgi:uncharacterized protein (DUF302 family)